MMDRAGRIRGGIWGLLVGDALGVPYEFTPPDRLPSAIAMDPPEGFRRAHSGVPPGTWSDDGAQALCLLESLLLVGDLDVDDLSGRLVDWWRGGYLTPDGLTFDVGNQTAKALRRVAGGVAPGEAADTDEMSNGNGSLMRVLPLALWHAGTDAELVDLAHRQSVPTHAHVRAQVCCALYCLWARAELRDEPMAWSNAVGRLRVIYETDPVRTDELEVHVQPDRPPGGQGSGYVVDCLHSARAALQTDSYEEAVIAAVRFGNDTDTTACVAGGIAGVRWGEAAIPPWWMAAMRGSEIVEGLLAGLLAAGGSGPKR